MVRRPELANVSQTERLRSAMAASAVTHGQEVRADIERVEVSTKSYAKPLVYFCRVADLRVRQTVRPGDGTALPAEVQVSGLTVDGEGFYDIHNALIRSNGRIQVVLDEKSRVVARPRSLMAFLLDA